MTKAAKRSPPMNLESRNNQCIVRMESNSRVEMSFCRLRKADAYPRQTKPRVCDDCTLQSMHTYHQIVCASQTKPSVMPDPSLPRDQVQVACGRDRSIAGFPSSPSPIASRCLNVSLNRQIAQMRWLQKLQWILPHNSPTTQLSIIRCRYRVRRPGLFRVGDARCYRSLVSLYPIAFSERRKIVKT